MGDIFFAHYHEISIGAKSSKKARQLVLLTEKLSTYETFTLEWPVIGFVLLYICQRLLIAQKDDNREGNSRFL